AGTDGMNRRHLLLVTSLVLSFVTASFGTITQRTQTFDADPGWNGVDNRIVPTKRPTVTQDFGYSAKTNFAGKSSGEMGGQLQRASEPAFYADSLAPVKTLDDKLSAAGSFALTKSESGAGMFFGFFR